MGQAADTRYEPHAIEARRQAAWRERDAFRTPGQMEEQPHLYIKPSAPFTSGNVHMGHVRSYSIGDAYARFRRARGDGVLFAFGFDAFGLPAELAAIAGGVPPDEWVQQSAAHMTGQLERLGFSFDWERSFMSSDAVMYRWSQWLFLVLLEAGLIYHGTGNVDWCENCQTTLASIQVEPGGTCWRCHGPVRLVEMPQWYLRISTYLEENDRRLAEREASGLWDEVATASQEIVLGRVDGVALDLGGPEGEQLEVFTPHSDAVAQAHFVMISPRHPDADAWASEPRVREQLEQLRTGGWERSAREAETIPLIDTGRVLSGAGGLRLPVIVSPLVDSRFGVTAVLGVPAADHADEVVATRLGLEAEPPQTGPDAAAVAPQPRPAVRYRAFDFAVSRQRSWGTPIPIVYCESCGAVPVAREQLPVVLPLDLRPTGTGNPLAEREDFVNTSCPACGGRGRRETDTLDCHFDALWLWVPACVPAEAREDPLEEIFALPDLRYWLPSERVVAGSDSGNFVFDQRTVTKALRDIGPLEFLTVRLAVLYAARPQRSLNWSDSAVLRCHRYLAQVWDYTQARLAAAARADERDAQAPAEVDADARDNTEHLRLKLSQWCEKAVEKVTEDFEALEMHSAVRNVMRLFDRIKDFEKRVLARSEELNRANREALLQALELHAQMLAPCAPHVAEELWMAFGHEGHGAQTPWPGVSFEVPA
jgi:leucyl-tRNA synthetase